MVKSNPQYIDQAHELGKRIYVWTVNDVESMRIVSNYDVDGIITDYPLKALDVVYSDYKFNLMDELLRLFNPQNKSPKPDVLDFLFTLFIVFQVL